MSENLGSAVLELRADGSVFDRDMGKAEGRAKTGAGRIGNALKTAGKVAGLAMAGIAAAALFGAKKAIDAAKNLGESVNAVNVVFGKAADKVLAFGDVAAKQAGLSKRAFNELVTPVGAALQNVGYGADQAADASINLAKRAADMASVFNVEVSDALGAIQAGLRGEADPLERFGVGLSDAAVKAKAMEMGLATSGKELDANAKTQARVALLMEQTNKLAGDFVNTSGEAANTERILAAQRENDAAKIGQALIPAYTALLHVVAAVTPVLMAWAGALAEKVGPTVERTIALVRDKWPQIQQVIKQVGDVIGRVFDFLVSAARTAWPHIVDAAERAVAWYRGTLQPTITSVINTLKALWERFGADITRIATTYFGMVQAVVRNALNVIKGTIEFVLAVLRGDWGAAWTALKLVVSNTLAGIGNLIRGFATIALQAAAAVGRAIVDGILSGVGGLFTMLKNKLEGILKGVLSSLNPFSPVEHGGEVYIGRPLAEGAVKGWVFGAAALPEKMAESVRQAVERARQQVESLRGKFGDAWGVLAGDALSAFDAVMGKIETKSEQTLSKLRADRDAAARASAVTEARGALGAAQAGTDGVVDPSAVAAAQKQLDDALWAQREFGLQQRAEQERRELDARIALRRRKFEERLADLETEAQREGMKTSEIHARLTKLYASFGIAYRSSGEALGKAFAQGMRDAEAAVAKAAEALAKVAESRLKLRSPAEKGPLSKLDSWWANLGATLTSGMQLGPVGAAIDSQLALAGGAGGGIVLERGAVQVNGWVGSDQQIAERLAYALDRNQRAGGLG